jgi:hypothetical protein
MPGERIDRGQDEQRATCCNVSIRLTEAVAELPMRAFRVLAGILLGAVLGGFIAFIGPIIVLGTNLSGLVGLLLAPAGAIAGALLAGIYGLLPGGPFTGKPGSGETSRQGTDGLVDNSDEDVARKAPEVRLFDALNAIVPGAALGGVLGILSTPLLVSLRMATHDADPMSLSTFAVISLGALVGGLGGGVYWWLRSRPASRRTR